MEQTFILSAVRTAIGSFNGSLTSQTAPQLGAVVVQEAVSRAGLSGDVIQEIIMGNVLAAGLGQAPARQAALLAGLPLNVQATTINKMCGSGLQAVALADMSIRTGNSSVVVAGGQESMTNAPYILPKARNGYRMGDGVIIDSMMFDGLRDAYKNVPMGECAELCAAKYQFTREQQDTYTIMSYERAQKAQKDGIFRDEIIAVTIKEKKGDLTVDMDEEPSKVHFEKLKTLKPVFQKDGTITAANASTINDGAAALVLASSAYVKQSGAKPMAKILAHASFAQEPEWFTTAPVGAINTALNRAGLSLNDIHLFEINEAFSVVPLAVHKELGVSTEQMNIYGGAVSLGHPIGASGARILTTLIYALKRTNQRYGLAALCIGGGEGIAMIIENV